MVPLPEVHTRDSAHTQINSTRDSIFVDRWHYFYQKGDTVYKTDSIAYDRWHTREVHDTTFVTRRDSIPYPVDRPVPYRERNAYDKITARGFWLFLLLLAIRIGVLAIRYYIKKRSPV